VDVITDSIMRKNLNIPSVVIISLEDYNAIEETVYLLRNPINTKKLLESIRQYEQDKYQEI